MERNNPAATSSTSDSATCSDHEAPRIGAAPLPPGPLVSAPRSELRGKREAPGPMPKSSAVRIASDAVDGQHAPVERQIQRDARVGRRQAPNHERLAHAANSSPAAAPIPASRRLSTSSCRASRQRERAEREPHAHLMAARAPRGEQQVGDVRAGHEQDERDDGEDRQQRPGVDRAAGRIGRRCRPPPARGRTAPSGKPAVARSRRLSRPRISGCIARSAAVAESIDWPGLSRNMAVNISARMVERARAPRITGSAPSGRATSNGWPTSTPKNSGGVTPTIVQRHAVDRQRRADHVRGAAESPLPEPIADDRDRAVRAAALHVVGGREHAAEQRGHAERRKKSPLATSPSAGCVSPPCDRSTRAGAQAKPPVERRRRPARACESTSRSSSRRRP